MKPVMATLCGRQAESANTNAAIAANLKGVGYGE